MPPKKANKVPRRWRPADRPGRHTGRSLGAVALAGVVSVGAVGWAVSGSDVLEGSGLSLGERRTVTADREAGDRPSSAAAVPVAFEGGPTTTATGAAPASAPVDRAPTTTADRAGAGAITSGAPAVTVGAGPAPRPSRWLLRPLAPAPGSTVLPAADSTVTPVADSTTTSSTTTSTRPPTTRPPTTSSSSSTTSSTTTSSTTSTTTPPTSGTTPEVDPTGGSDEDGTTTSSAVDGAPTSDE